MKITVGFLIFLALFVILWAFGLIFDFSEGKDNINFLTCRTCLLKP